MPDTLRPASTIGFRPVTAADLDMLGNWLARPHLREWWGDPDQELGEIRDTLAGTDSTEPYLFTLNGIPAGYIQMWRVADMLTEPRRTEAPWLWLVPQDAVGVDLCIADPNRLSIGIGTDVLRVFVADLRKRGFQTILIDPDAKNRRAIRAYEKAGFRLIPELQGRSGDCRILRHHKDKK